MVSLTDGFTFPARHGKTSEVSLGSAVPASGISCWCNHTWLCLYQGIHLKSKISSQISGNFVFISVFWSWTIPSPQGFTWISKKKKVSVWQRLKQCCTFQLISWKAIFSEQWQPGRWGIQNYILKLPFETAEFSRLFSSLWISKRNVSLSGLTPNYLIQK